MSTVNIFQHLCILGCIYPSSTGCQTMKGVDSCRYPSFINLICCYMLPLASVWSRLCLVLELCFICLQAKSVMVVEVSAPAWLHRFIIGKKGQNIGRITQQLPRVRRRRSGVSDQRQTMSKEDTETIYYWLNGLCNTGGAVEQGSLIRLFKAWW